jgi:hypothetical protein
MMIHAHLINAAVADIGKRCWQSSQAHRSGGLSASETVTRRLYPGAP